MRTPMRTQWMAGAVAMVLAGAVLVSCGDDSGDDTAAVATTVSLPGKVTDKGTTDLGTASDLDLELDDQYFAPTFINAPAGATVQVKLENEGKIAHTFTIDGTSIDQQVGPGDSATVEVTLPDSGSLRFYCRFHVSGGMQGAFVVSDGAASGTATTVVTSAGSAGGGSGY